MELTIEEVCAYEFKPGVTYVLAVTLSKDISKDKMYENLRILHRCFETKGISVIIYPKGYGIDNIEVIKESE